MHKHRLWFTLRIKKRLLHKDMNRPRNNRHAQKETHVG